MSERLAQPVYVLNLEILCLQPTSSDATHPTAHFSRSDSVCQLIERAAERPEGHTLAVSDDGRSLLNDFLRVLTLPTNLITSLLQLTLQLRDLLLELPDLGLVRVVGVGEDLEGAVEVVVCRPGCYNSARYRWR